ncbi:MAG: U32 family peptidase [Clostridia bacterium]|nr:U32 family peptidase [Clostridia bacterium]
MMELLAPAGDFKALEACVKAGADAVYLGLESLNARRGAANFTPDELIRACDMLHERGMKVYVTLNTLVRDGEFKDLESAAKAIAHAGADAAIVQDMGVAMWLKAALPSLKLHASTQMAIHNYQGVKYLKSKGFDRAILAREVTLGGIRDCAGQGVEIEVFGHGALCVSCSGQCLMSSIIGGRSGNRGMCAQPCRLNYTIGDAEGELLSPKDLMTIGFLPALESAGVKSLKLEGRLKPPKYVYAVVSAYRRALDGEKVNPDILTHVFNRGYTRGYFFGADDRDLISDPREEHIQPGEIDFEPRAKKIAISIKAHIAPGKPLVMEAADGVDAARVNGDEAQYARKAALDVESASRQLLKTGDTPYAVEQSAIDLGEGVFTAVSSLNALRRDCLSSLSKKRIERLRGCERELIHVPPVEMPFVSRKRPLLSVEASTPDMLRLARECGADEVIYAPCDVRDILFEGIDADAIAVPATLPGRDLDALNRRCLDAGFKATIISNPAHLAMDWPGEVRADWPMNIFNSFAVKGLSMPYAPSVELTMPEIAALPGEKELIVYGRVTLMRLRLCPIRAAGSKGAHAACRACGDGLFTQHPLVDRRNVAFPLMRLQTSEGCIINVLNSVPIMLLRHVKRICPSSRWRVILTDEDEATAGIVIRAHTAAIRGLEIPDYGIIDSMRTTTAHYFRGVD